MQISNMTITDPYFEHSCVSLLTINENGFRLMSIDQTILWYGNINKCYKSSAMAHIYDIHGYYEFQSQAHHYGTRNLII